MAPITFSFADSGVNPLRCLEDGVRAERAGFETVWVSDHYVDVDCERLEPWTILSAIAASTRKIRLASGVTDTQRTHPTRTAHMVACVDVLSKGRAVLGIGAGEAMNIVPFGLPWEAPLQRLNRLKEAVDVIHLLWNSSIDHPKNFSGRFFNLQSAHLDQPPTQKPHPPVYIGAIASRLALEIVGKIGDGWYGWLNTPQTFRKRWDVIARSAISVGRSPTQIKATTQLMVAFPRSSDEEKTAMLSAKASMLVERSVLRSLGVKLNVLEQYQNLIISRENTKKILNIASSIPDEFVHRVMAVGGIEEVEEKVEELSRVGIRQIAICDITPPRNVNKIMKVFPRLIKAYGRLNGRQADRQ